MMVKQLREILEEFDGDTQVKILADTPDGWVCPDGCAIDIQGAGRGIDWHSQEFLIFPKYDLQMTQSSVREWEKRR